MSKRKRKTAAEVLAELRSNPAWVEGQQERDEVFRRNQAEYAKAERPVVKALNAAGVPVSSVWDLVNSGQPYPGAIPVLLDHLRRQYPERVREGIARALAVREARPGWDTLLGEFLRIPGGTTQGTKWALACALDVASDDSVLGKLIELMRDRSHGRNRLPLLAALLRSRAPQARDLVEELRSDPDLAAEIGVARPLGGTSTKRT